MRRSLATLALTAVVCAGCETGPTKEQIEAAKNSIDCERPGEHLVIQFGNNEARIIVPGTETVVLYQVPSTSGARFMNGSMELRGRGKEVELVRDQAATHFTCKPLEIPKKK
ncbi:MAG TPA: MliC family protein [Casimicrobiaceae bacterium]|nr:MliC family protein [Casimicrobiaceae bacterium]